MIYKVVLRHYTSCNTSEHCIFLDSTKAIDEIHCSEIFILRMYRIAKYRILLDSWQPDSARCGIPDTKTSPVQSHLCSDELKQLSRYAASERYWIMMLFLICFIFRTISNWSSPNNYWVCYLYLYLLVLLWLWTVKHQCFFTFISFQCLSSAFFNHWWT